MPQGAAAVDEANIRRVGYMQQAMVTMMCALLTAMVAKYVHGIKVEHEASKEEKEYVERMFGLFSFHWILVTGMNFLLATDPFLESQTSQTILDFIIGAICGVNIVILIEYVRGWFFVEGQDESDFITIMAYLLYTLGAITWTLIGYVVFLIFKEIMSHREQKLRRLNIVNQMQGIPFGNLAFNIDQTCSICFESFK